MVDAVALEATGEIREGSSPFIPTKFEMNDGTNEKSYYCGD